MTSMHSNRVSTGIAGLDQAIDMLRLGDNVVWQVDTIAEYQEVVGPFVKKSKESGFRVIYVRFGSHQALLSEEHVDHLYVLDPSEGFESFATEIHQIMDREGPRVFYVFDCLSDLLEHWYSDLMIGNFFRVSCPFLFRLHTIAYFALMRETHTYSTIARIRGTTQLLLDMYKVEGETYIHPLKVAERYSPTMFFPHLIQGEDLISITSSLKTALLFSEQSQLKHPRDYWDVTIDRAKVALAGGAKEQDEMKSLLIKLIISRESAIVDLVKRYLTLSDLLHIAAREIGTGYIGGKSIGFLLARRILANEAPKNIQEMIEPHDSFYLGSDIYYTYIVQNECWHLRMKQKTPDGYFSYAKELQEKILTGEFPSAIREQFLHVLEYFGQSPIIVRSSSLLEDNYGNAFAGKYESVFCANQGSPEERYESFENAIRVVYASTMNLDALKYRKDRGLMGKDEQMAVLVQRVSGDHYENLFYPHIAGVANSMNTYVWDTNMDPSAGMLRLVFGLGTRAVDRTPGDHARLVALDRPEKKPPVEYEDEAKYSQRYGDVIDLLNNTLAEIPVNEIAKTSIGTRKDLFFTADKELITRMKETGRTLSYQPLQTDFATLLSETAFPNTMRTILALLEKAYQYPVDVEFAANFDESGSFYVNVLQCRPLQTKGLGDAEEEPDPPRENVFIKTNGSFMGGNVHIPLDWVIFIKPKEYLQLTEQERFQLARTIGKLNHFMQTDRALLIGPGRWGATITSLGVPVHFTEINHMSAIAEVAYKELAPELSFGSHFFQDLVESNIFYAALYPEKDETVFEYDYLSQFSDQEFLLDLDPSIRRALLIAKRPNLLLYSNVNTQRLMCYAHPDRCFLRSPS